MTIQHWQIFICVCECGSATAAANHLFMTQSAVSRSISELEQYYNVELFDRSGRRMVPTKEGRAILGHAKDLLDYNSRMEDFIRGMIPNLNAKVGASLTFAQFIMPEALEEFKQKYPGIEIGLTKDVSSNLEQQVINGELNLAFIERPPESSLLKVQKFQGDQLVFFCALGNPLADHSVMKFEDLLGEKFWLKVRGHYSRDLLEAYLLLNGYTINCAYESINSNSIISGIKKCDHVGSMAFWQTREALLRQEISVINVADCRLRRDFFCISRVGYELTRNKEQSFIDIVEKVAKKKHQEMEEQLSKLIPLG